MIKYCKAVLFGLFTIVTIAACEREPEATVPVTEKSTVLDQFVAAPSAHFSFEHKSTIAGDGVTTHVLRMVSGHWLTESEVDYPEWWHWMTLVVPDSVGSSTGLLAIGGGSRDSEIPTSAPEELEFIAKETGAVVTYLHNVPNQPIEFVGDNYGPRVEDELISYGWRQFLEGGAVDDTAVWLARLPMTNAAVRAMDAVTAYSSEELNLTVDRFMVMGGSKRGWTTWTAAAVDDRVVAIVPIVIDLLNVIPSFEHHWQAYGFWAPAVGDYVEEGIMEWQNSAEYTRLTEIVEPYSYRHRLDMPKLLINASGDQFFLPDSWQFYWDELIGEKHIRYVPNTGHSLSGSDVYDTITAFFHSVITDHPRPEPNWRVEGSAILVDTGTEGVPTEIRLWQATNSESRDFRVDEAGEIWTSEIITPSPDGSYRFEVPSPATGWTAFFVEFTYPGQGTVPLKVTTGTVVVPDTLPFPPYRSPTPMGTQSTPDS